jgi:hypothetical protein
VPETEEQVDSRTTTAPPPTTRRTVSLRLLVLVVVLAVIAVVVAVNRTGTAAADDVGAMSADTAVTKTYQELERQSLLPPSQRSIDVLEAVLATPQSDRTGPLWETEVVRSRLGGTTLVAEVVTTWSPSPLSAPTSYLDFVVQVTPSADPGASVGIRTCAVRSGSSAAPLATSTVWVTDHLLMEPCSSTVLADLGITS